MTPVQTLLNGKPYVHSSKSDIRVLFAKIRAEMAQKEKK